MSSPSNACQWLNRTVLGIGLASLFSDWSDEIATTAMPAFLATMAVVILAGLLTSTALNLLVLPPFALGYGRFEKSNETFA